MEPRILRAANGFRARLIANDKAVALELAEAYKKVWQRIQTDLSALTTEMKAAQDRGEKIDAAWLNRKRRLLSFQKQVKSEIERFSQMAAERAVQEQALAVKAVLTDVEALILARMPSGELIQFNRLNTEALSDLVGFMSDGSPLRDLFNEFGSIASQQARDALFTGVALGQGGRQIAQALRKALGVILSRALTIARTEVLRAYRESTRRYYRVNSDLVMGWIWTASLSRRTCAACWAMHGTFHQLDERLDGHPNCRCTMVPATKTWQELGFDVPETRVEIESGVSLFDQLSKEDQLFILGPAKYDAWSNSLFSLGDLVGRRHSDRWGTMRYERSLREVLV